MSCCRLPRRTCGLKHAVRDVCQEQDEDVDQRKHCSEDNPKPCNWPQQITATRPRTLSHESKSSHQPLSQIPQATTLEDFPIITATSHIDSPAVRPQSCHSLCPQLPLSAQGRVGGRLGVSFCFSRRGPRLEPSASVFSDLEEEEREKREQMRERVKAIMEDIDREIMEAEKRKKSRSDCNVPIQMISGDAKKEEEQMEKTDVANKGVSISTAAPHHQTHDLQGSQSQMQVTKLGTTLRLVHMEPQQTSETETKQALDAVEESSEFLCVLGRNGSSRLRWPVSLLKFTKSEPHVSFSCNPLCMNVQAPEQLTGDLQESQQNQLRTLSGVPTAPTPDTCDCSQRRARRELRTRRRRKHDEILKREQHISVETEAHLLLKNKTLPSPVTGLQKGRCMLREQNCERAASHPSDPGLSDSSDTNSQNPLGGRLEGARGIRKRAITALSCKLESVTQPGTQGMCISLSRCECGNETKCECGRTPRPYVGVPKVPHKRRKINTKKLAKEKRVKKEKASHKRQSAKCKVRSVVSTVCTAGQESRGEAEVRWGKRRRRRRGMRQRGAGSNCLLGGCETEPVSVSVRKKRPHRKHSAEFKSQAGSERAKHAAVDSRLSRHTADRDAEGGRQQDRGVATFPWRSRISVRSFSPGRNLKPFWERGHHSNPRSFIDCCYPDNSCGSGPAKKRKLLHGDRKSIHGEGSGEVWERSGGKMVGHLGWRDRGLILDTEQWEWVRAGGDEEGASRTGWRHRATEWNHEAGFSPSPKSWGRRHRRFSTEDVDWDKWTWGSSDSWEDRGTCRSSSSFKTAVDDRETPGGTRRCATTRRSSSRHFSSPEWWMSRQLRSCQSVMGAQGSRCHSPRSCSPCSSTNMSELSCEWSKSSTCSGGTVDSLIAGCSRTSSAAAEASQGAEKHSSTVATPPTLLSCPSPQNSAPKVSCLNPCDGSPQEPSVCVTTSSSGAALPQKPARALLLPLIGKRPAIQRKARREKGLQEKSLETEREEEARSHGEDVGTTGDSQKCLLNIAESNPSRPPNLCLPQIRTNDKQAGGETAAPISFSAEEMDKYRVLQEQAREHMQKVLENTQESANVHTHTEYTHNPHTGSYVTSDEQYKSASLHSPAQLETQIIHPDILQRQVQHTFHVSVPLQHVTPQERFTPPVALGVPSLPPLPPSPPLSNLHHILLQQAALSIPHHVPSTSSPSPSPAIHPPSSPRPPSLPHPLHLTPLSISSLFPSILLSHHPIPLLAQSLHTSPLTPLSPVALQPLNSQPFMDTPWPVRFQQKAI